MVNFIRCAGRCCLITAQRELQHNIFSWLAIFLSRRISCPILILREQWFGLDEFESRVSCYIEDDHAVLGFFVPYFERLLVRVETPPCDQ